MTVRVKRTTVHVPGPSPAESLVSALAGHAAVSPEAPWLFSPRGHDWTWISWREGARRMAAMAGALVAAGLPPGARVTFLDVPRPETVCLDLALRAAGLAPVPLATEETGAAAGCAAWVAILGEPGPELPAEVAPLRVPWESARDAPAVALFAGRAPGEEDLLAAAARLAAALPPGRDLGRSRREIVVFGGKLGDREDRVVLTWALLAGAAVLLEPEPAAVVPSAVWARPTLFHGDASRLAALRQAIERLRGRPGRGVPLGRLHTLVPTGSAALSGADLAFWRGRGVAVLSQLT